MIVGYPTEGSGVEFKYKLCFLFKGLCFVFKRNSIEFLIDFLELEYFLNIRLSYKFRYMFFKQVLISMYVLRVLRRCFEKSMHTQRHVTVATCSTSDIEA